MESESNNPYAPPAAPIAEAKSGFDMATFDEASNWKRFFNWLIDRVAMVGFVLLFVMGLAFLDGAGVPEPLAWFEGLTRIGELVTEWMLALCYYSLMETTFGLTLGKLVTGTRVVDETGKKPSLAAILGRTLARFVPFEPFSFFGDSGWHDRWSGTRVIDIRNQHRPLSPGLRKIYGRR